MERCHSCKLHKNECIFLDLGKLPGRRSVPCAPFGGFTAKFGGRRRKSGTAGRQGNRRVEWI